MTIWNVRKGRDVALTGWLWYHIIMKINLPAAVLATSLLTGCFTVSETRFPEVVQTSLAPDKNLSVQISGFEATVTTYIPVYGWETVYDSTPCRRHRRHIHSYTTVATQSYIPKVENTATYINQATDILEKCGFVLQGSAPQYRIDVVFSGPYVSNGDSALSHAWTLLSLFTAEYGVQTWSARLKIYDNATGKVCLYNDYSQKYESLVWGPIPFFSPAGSDKSSYGYMQSWCLSALTDRVMADATAFLSAKAR